MSRAQWLALGSTLVVASSGCAKVQAAIDPASADAAVDVSPPLDAAPDATPDEAVDATVGDDAAADIDAASDAPMEGGPHDGGVATTCLLQGTLECGDAGPCDLATQFCVINPNSIGLGTPRCEAYDASGACGGCPQCACATAQWTDTCEGPSNYEDPTGCSEDDAGAITVQVMSCGPCYGAPPSQLA